MSPKTIPFKNPKPLDKPADDWIGEGTAARNKQDKAVSGPTKRLTVDIAEDLHRRIKVHCATEGVQIADIVRDLLATEFPTSQA